MIAEFHPVRTFFRDSGGGRILPAALFRFLLCPLDPEFFPSLALASGADCGEGFKGLLDPGKECAGLPPHGKEEPAVPAVEDAEIVDGVRVSLPLVGGVGIPDDVPGKSYSDLVFRRKVKPFIFWKGRSGEG